MSKEKIRPMTVRIKWTLWLTLEQWQVGTIKKAKDTKNTWKQLFTYSKKYVAGFIIAVITAVAGTVLALIGPNRLSEITNMITAGMSATVALADRTNSCIPSLTVLTERGLFHHSGMDNGHHHAENIQKSAD